MMDVESTDDLIESQNVVSQTEDENKSNYEQTQNASNDVVSNQHTVTADSVSIDDNASNNPIAELELPDTNSVNVKNKESLDTNTETKSLSSNSSVQELKLPDSENIVTEKSSVESIPNKSDLEVEKLAMQESVSNTELSERTGEDKISDLTQTTGNTSSEQETCISEENILIGEKKADSEKNKAATKEIEVETRTDELLEQMEVDTCIDKVSKEVTHADKTSEQIEEEICIEKELKNTKEKITVDEISDEIEEEIQTIETPKQMETEKRVEETSEQMEAEICDNDALSVVEEQTSKSDNDDAIEIRTDTETDSASFKETVNEDNVFTAANESYSGNNETDLLPTDSNLDCSSKDIPEKNIEPENTEFVQFSQDKNDDSQIENQPTDAEDPFGGDNLPSDNIEQMETDVLVEGDIGFPKLCEQADNLQDAVKANANFNRDCNMDSLKEKEQDITKDSESIELSSNLLDKDDPSVEEGNKKTDVSKSIDKDIALPKKDTNVITSIETDVQQSDVLPGQDDELCIIPDSMKVIIPGTSKKSTSEEISSQNKIGESCSEKMDSSNIQNALSNLQEINTIKPTDDKNKKTTSAPENALTIENIPTADIINLEDEAKEVEEIGSKEKCKQCNEEKSCKIKVKIGLESYNVCSKTCKALFKAANNKATDIPSDGVNSKREKRCANCLLIIEPNDEKNLSWETMEFCNEECLGKFQMRYGSYCRNCNGTVQAVSLGKYCVRFGYDVRQFCCSTCLEEFKKGLKVCSYCQKDISSGTEGFLAPVGDKGQFKDFCTQDCMEKYSRMSSAEPVNVEKKSCSVCQEEKLVHCEVQVDKGIPVAMCSEPCFAAFKFVNKVDPDQCSTCKMFFEIPNRKGYVVFYENEAHAFCTKTCLNIFIITNRKIVPCSWCKVKKYNFDMIRKELKTGQVMTMCSLNCLTLYQVSVNAVSAKRIHCDFCKEFSQAQYHLTMSDATIRNFCSYNCVMNFQAQYTKSPITIPSSDDPVPTGMPKRTVPQRVVSQTAQKTNEIQNKKTLPVISSVTSLANIANGQSTPTTQQTSTNNISSSGTTQTPSPQIIYKQQIITRPPSPVKVSNKKTQCKPLMHTKGVSVRPHPCTKSTQTDKVQQAVVPIPVPIYVPFPMHMYSMPFPVPVPFPIPIPVPIFIPTTRNSAKGIFKDIKRIQEKIPADPFEAELLMMAEMVATEKKSNESDSDSGDDRDNRGENAHADGFSPVAVDSNNTFGDDMLQMALKMATGELDEPAVDLEAALTPNTITATQAPAQTDTTIENDVSTERLVSTRGRKRMVPYKPRSTPSKRGRRSTAAASDIPLMPPPEPQPPPQPRIIEPIEKPDANMALKYTFGVNAWRQWVITKNTELEKQSTPTRKMKLFKTDLLQLTTDELNYSLCLFVKEVRKPNGAEYAPDTIYYLCLGIQQYLIENNRIDNIFTDSYYETFTDCLNEVAKKFSVLYNDAQYIVTRVEEEHLWECKQLGAHSPHVLLNTLMFFNTKHFNLVTVEEHMQLSFSHIMKHWKRNPAAQPAAVAGKAPGSRNVLLRFYPPQSALDANSRKKKVYEQQENEENPLRCPVKLYEFYLSKCPESVKTRNDVFYLLPERSCVPDSPVWYSTSPLAKENLVKMLYRVKMVKEINVALLTS